MRLPKLTLPLKAALYFGGLQAPGSAALAVFVLPRLLPQMAAAPRLALVAACGLLGGAAMGASAFKAFTWALRHRRHHPGRHHGAR